MSDPWLLEGAMLASCYVVGMGVAAASVLQGGGNQKKKKNRRKTRSGGGASSSMDSGSTTGTQFSRSSLGTNTSGVQQLTSNGHAEDLWSPHDHEDDEEELPLCPNDLECSQLNDPLHYQSYAHTCRLNPCYHAHVEKHCHYFRHSEGQCVGVHPPSNTSATQPLTTAPPRGPPTPSHFGSGAPSSHASDFSPDSSIGGSTMASTGKSSPKANRRRRGKGKQQSAERSNTSGVQPSQALISPNVPNAVQIGVRSECNQEADGDDPYQFYVWGDWTKVRGHALKRYFHQVVGVPPQDMRVFVETQAVKDVSLVSGDKTQKSSQTATAKMDVVAEQVEVDDMEVVGDYLSSAPSALLVVQRTNLSTTSRENKS